jgi:hypothetical protein
MRATEYLDCVKNGIKPDAQVIYTHLYIADSKVRAAIKEDRKQIKKAKKNGFLY